MRDIDPWLARLSDPAALNPLWPVRPLASAGRVEALLDEAQGHNVRPVIARHLAALLREAPGEILRAPDDAQRQTLIARIETARLMDLGRAVVLAEAGREIQQQAEADRLPLVIVKGADFAANVYGGLHNRTFTDVDLLVDPRAVVAVNGTLESLGYAAHEATGKRVDYTERQWTRREGDGQLLVEVHTDLVHAPELRRRQRLDYTLYAGAEAGGVTNAARLVLAGLHGATSHLFGRLQYVTDGMMIARAGVDAGELRERASASGASLAVATMLRLASEIYGCEKSAALRKALGPVRGGGFEQRLIPGAMLLSAKGAQRWRHLPRRHAYRWLLQRA